MDANETQTELDLLRAVLRAARPLNDEWPSAALGDALLDYDRYAASLNPRVWALTRHNLIEVDRAFESHGINVRGFWVTSNEGSVCDGLKIGSGRAHIVARYGDTVELRGDGAWNVSHAKS